MISDAPSFFWRDHRTRTQLPIDKRLNDILSFIEDYQVVICEAGTGAGKTTRIPQAALLSDDQLKIIMTQPRRNICRWIGERVAAELGTQPGDLVGWRLLGEKPKVSRETRLEFMVDQSLINRINNQKKLPNGLIIIDEAHERSVAIDLLLGLIKEKLPNSPNTKVLITSATIDTTKFSQFFDNAPVISVTGRCFPVTTNIFYLQQGEHHTEGAIRAAKGVLHDFHNENLFITDEANQQKMVEKGTILVLLPGKEDINNAQRALDEVSSLYRTVNTKKIEVLSCHGGSSQEEQSQVQTEVRENTLRFICCTELLRASVTVPGCVGVIDSLQVKRLITNDKGVSCLDKVPVSKAEADQAKGRAGRITSGFYIPVSFNNEYEQLAPYPEPAILREPITHVVLKIVGAGLSVHHFAFIDKPSDGKILFALTQLKSMGAITKQETLTENGRLLMQLPIDPEHGMILITANKLDVLPEAMIVTAGLEAEGFFHCGKRDATKKKIKMTWAGETGNDFAAIVRGYRAYKQAARSFKTENRRFYYRNFEQHMKTWCVSRGINFKSIGLMEERISQIEDSLKSSNMRVSHLNYTAERDFNEKCLLKAMISGKATCVAEARGHSSTENFFSKLGDFSLSDSSMCHSSSKLILVAGLRKIHIPRHGFRLVADCSSPIEAIFLSETLPQLCTKKYDSYRYDINKDLVTAIEKCYFNDDIEISASEVILSGEEAMREKSQWLAKQITHENRSLATINTRLNAVLLFNIEIQAFAKKMNRIAGEAVFKIYTYQEWYEKIHIIMGDVDSLSQLSLEKIKQLALPALDKCRVEKIYQDNPENIIVGDLTLKIDYRMAPLTPLVQAKESQIPCWVNFLNDSFRLPGGRQIHLQILRNNGRHFDVNWINRHVNLATCDITNIKFVDDKQFCLTRLDSEKLKNTLPYFLPLSAFNNINSFDRELRNFNMRQISFDQERFVQWSILFQILNCSEKSMIKDLLELLMTSTFMKQKNYLSGIEVVGSFFSGFFYQNSISMAEIIGRVDIVNFMSQLSQDKLPQIIMSFNGV